MFQMLSQTVKYTSVCTFERNCPHLLAAEIIPDTMSLGRTSLDGLCAWPEHTLPCSSSFCRLVSSRLSLLPASAAAAAGSSPSRAGSAHPAARFSSRSASAESAKNQSQFERIDSMILRERMKREMFSRDVLENPYPRSQKVLK